MHVGALAGPQGQAWRLPGATEQAAADGKERAGQAPAAP